MTTLISILCPSRRRLAWLTRCIQSIVSNADDQSCFEIIVRAHSDDKETIRGLWDLLSHKQLRVVIGHPLNGYSDLSRFYDEAAALAKGEWIWVMNDDVIVNSPKWDAAIKPEPINAILMPNHHRLSGLNFLMDMHTPFMFVPNKCWQKYGVTNFDSPFDSGLWTLLRNNGWPTRFVEISVDHTRKNDIELAEERQPLPSRGIHPNEMDCRA